MFTVQVFSMAKQKPVDANVLGDIFWLSVREKKKRCKFSK